MLSLIWSYVEYAVAEALDREVVYASPSKGELVFGAFLVERSWVVLGTPIKQGSFLGSGGSGVVVGHSMAV